jgi:serine protease
MHHLENHMLRRSLRQLLLVVLLGALVPLAAAQNVSRIRVMLHPDAADAGQLPAATLALLQTLAGVPLTLDGTTRTGALEFTLAGPLDAAASAALLGRLRNNRSVLWAESVASGSTAAKTAKAAKAKTITDASSAPGGRKLMLRLTGATAPDWGTLLPRLSTAAGSKLAVDRQIGNVWVLRVADTVPDAQLAQMAALLESDPAVQYADPVRRAYAQLVPNDTRYPQQWALADAVGGVSAPVAWDIQIGSATVAVAVVDTGFTAHPEIFGRVLPGYDFISDAQMANDGNGRDADGSDPGDWTDDNDCYDGSPAESSSWHGTFVSGLIAANTNNAAGIAGMDWNARILPIRVLGKCGGTFDDIVAGVLWAAGLPVAGAPMNATPARVINLSLGGATFCPQALQDAINAVLAQGSVITVAAGNEFDDVVNTAPANCSGVIAVGASTRQGDRASYSNFGHRVDLSAPGGDGVVTDWITSISNDGAKAPGAPSFARGIGTSFAAPHVAGTASLMFARNANLTPGQVLSIVTSTATPFLPGTQCALGGICGAGTLNAGLALQNTVSSVDSAPAGTVPVIEFYRGDLDHYVMLANVNEIEYFDTVLASVYRRTGEVFYAWADPALAPPGTPLQAVCRFSSPLPLINSFIFTASDSQCQFMSANYPGIWYLDTSTAFYVLLSDGAGACPASSLPIYRFFNNRNDANMRHTRDLTVRRAMLNKQWAPYGFGPNGVAFCSPV